MRSQSVQKWRSLFSVEWRRMNFFFKPIKSNTIPQHTLGFYSLMDLYFSFICVCTFREACLFNMETILLR